ESANDVKRFDDFRRQEGAGFVKPADLEMAICAVTARYLRGFGRTRKLQFAQHLGLMMEGPIGSPTQKNESTPAWISELDGREDGLPRGGFDLFLWCCSWELAG